MARSLAMTTERPGGTPSPFCVAEMTTSTPHSSNLISSEATEQTASRTMSVSGECSLTSLLNLAAGDSTPVEVSTERVSRGHVFAGG